MIKRILLSILLIAPILAFAQKLKNYKVKSPDGLLSITINTNKNISFYLTHGQDTIISPSKISMSLDDGEVLGENAKVRATKTSSVNNIINPPVYKRLNITDKYNELIISFYNNFSLTFIAYNEGIAYRFATTKKSDFKVVNEEVNFNFPADRASFIPFVDAKSKGTFEQQFFNSFENTYTTKNISELDPKKLAFLPLVVEAANGKKVCITEADLESYPGLFLNHPLNKITLSGVFAPYPKFVKQGGNKNIQEMVTEREKYIAKCSGTRQFPWRVMAVSTSDKMLADNDLVYKLASPSRIKDASWIKPGKVAWEWWNDWNIKDVDFKAGVNNATYKYYIDFAASHKLPYVIMDAGWAVNNKADLMQVVPEINIKELVDYAKEKNVSIILWAGYKAFDKDMDNVCRHYAGLGVKGFKIDFMNRDDQQMVDFYYRAASTCAKYKLLADFHGAYKPTGLQRTYPNVINFEGVFGMEQMKWSADTVDHVTYDVTMPYIRMLAGPVDYTQGAMRNSTRKTYAPIFSEPMSQGTRCHQLAEYVIFESPLNMLCDAPFNYVKEAACTEFISSVPSVWDETIALNGEIGKYLTIARKKGNDWYIGSLTNWNERELSLDLSFLGKGNYKAEIFADGVNADRNASDFKKMDINIPADKKLKIKMAPGGGYAMKVYAVN